MQYGLMTYKYTINLGNEIQSIAARRFLPKIDHYIDHEELHLFSNSEKVKMIMNGWYLDCLDAWPPSKDIDPLLISMHFNTSVNETKEVILSDESRDFFSSYGPVGCRDYPTVELLDENGIDAYYSGCLTLTLESANMENENKYIVVNSIKSKPLIKYLKTKTDLPIYDIYQLVMRSMDKKYLLDPGLNQKLTSFYDYNEKFLMAENLLNIYDNACCVITERLHAALPSLALNTPVLFINTAKFGLERLEGISNLVNETTLDDYRNDYSIFDVENPPENPDSYLKIRENLIKKTKKFTGYMDKDYTSYYPENQNFANMMLLNRTYHETTKYMKSANTIAKEQAERIRELENTVQMQEKRIAEMESDNKGSKGPLGFFRKG